MTRQALLIVGFLVAASTAHAQQQKVGDPPEASNMRLVGWSDLQARSAYQPTIHQQGNRWIAYIGHHGGTDDIPAPLNPMTGKAEPNGTSIVDVSDPANPKYLRHLPVLPGQQAGPPGRVPTELHGPISSGPQGNRVYFAYGTNKGGILQIVDREKLLKGPKEPAPDNLRQPVVGELAMTPWNGAHTTFPMPKMPIAEFARDKDGGVRDIVMIVDESILNECLEARQMGWF